MIYQTFLLKFWIMLLFHRLAWGLTSFSVYNQQTKRHEALIYFTTCCGYLTSLTRTCWKFTVLTDNSKLMFPDKKKCCSSALDLTQFNKELFEKIKENNNPLLKNTFSFYVSNWHYKSVLQG